MVWVVEGIAIAYGSDTLLTSAVHAKCLVAQVHPRAREVSRLSLPYEGCNPGPKKDYDMGSAAFPILEP